MQTRIGPFFILLGITLLFFVNALSSDWTFGYGDIHRYFYPIRYFTASSMKEGFLPLWNPYLFAGIPNLAALQPAVFYPISILPYLFPFFYGIELFIIVHFFLASLFTYLLMRHFKVSRAGALISALTYGFGGFLLSVVDMLTTLSAATWTPLIFLCYLKALGSDLEYSKALGSKALGSDLEYRICTQTQILYSRSDPNLANLVFTGLFLGIQFLAGEPTQLYGTLITLSLYTVAKAWQMWRQKGEKEKVTKAKLVKFCFQGLTPWLICLGLTLFQVLPFLEMVLHSTRTSGLKFTHATSLSLGPHELLNLVLPYWSGNFIEKSHFWFGQSWLESIYLGILPLLFALVAIVFGRKKRIVLFFTGIIFIFLLLSFGKLLPLYKTLYQYLPGFSMIRYPVKFFSFVVLGISVLAGFGLDRLDGSVKSNKSNLSDKILKLFSGFLLIYAGSFLVFFLNQQRIIPFLKEIYFPEALDIYVAAWADSLSGNFMLVCLITLAGILLISLLFKGKISTRVFNLGIIGLVIIDLFIFGMRINPLVPQKIYAYKSPALRFLLQDTDCYRILLEPKSERYFRIIRGETLEDALVGVQNSLVSNYGLFYKIFDAQGYESLTLNDYTRFLKLVTEQGDWNLLDVLNIKYVVSKFDLKMRQLKLVYEDESIKIYWNTTCLPRAFFVPKARVIRDRQRVLEEMSGVDFDPRKEIILEEKIRNPNKFSIFDFRFSISSIQNPKSKIQNPRIIDYQPNKVIITASSPGACLLFLSDTYYPGWRAFIDGKPTKIYRANYTFRAISFPEGSHTVEFVYLPLSFLVGVIGSGITVFISIGLILMWRKRG